LPGNYEDDGEADEDFDEGEEPFVGAPVNEDEGDDEDEGHYWHEETADNEGEKKVVAGVLDRVGLRVAEGADGNLAAGASINANV